MTNIPGERNDSPLQCSCLENPMDRGGWQATVHRVTKSQTWLKRLSTAHMTSIVPDLLGAEAPLQTNFPWEGGLEDLWREVLTHVCALLSLIWLSSFCLRPNPPQQSYLDERTHLSKWVSAETLSGRVPLLPTDKANSWTQCWSSSFEPPSTSFQPHLWLCPVWLPWRFRHCTSVIQTVHSISLHWANHILFCTCAIA